LKDYKYILFDLDGTLTDSKVGIAKSIKYALAKYNIEVENLESLESFVGPPLMESFKEHYSFNDEKSREALEYYREYFSKKGIFENEVYPEIQSLLEKLKMKGKILIVATSKPTIYAEKILKYFNLEGYFDFIVGSNLDGTRSSKSEVISYIISELNIKDLGKVVMIGDRKHDVIGGTKNHIHTIAVTYGYGSYEELKEAKPTYFANTPKEILDIIRNPQKPFSY